MTVPYEVAVANIENVFGGKIDREVVCAVLDANNGHMERTIDCLFSMINENGSEPAIENLSLEESSPASPQSQQQIKDDELYARMLQDQFFMAEMRHNPEFQDVFSVPQRHVRRSASGTTDSRPPPAAVSAQPEPDFTDKLAQLGTAAKLKLKELYTKFQPKKSPLKASKDGGQYLSVNTEEDDAEVVAFDSSVARRTAAQFDIDEGPENDEVPLTNSKKKGSVFSGSGGFQRLPSGDHQKDD